MWTEVLPKPHVNGTTYGKIQCNEVFGAWSHWVRSLKWIPWDRILPTSGVRKTSRNLDGPYLATGSTASLWDCARTPSSKDHWCSLPDLGPWTSRTMSPDKKPHWFFNLACLRYFIVVIKKLMTHMFISATHTLKVEWHSMILPVEITKTHFSERSCWVVFLTLKPNGFAPLFLFDSFCNYSPSGDALFNFFVLYS